ncbi:putative acetyltransferase [Dehalogenimonas alkenigignens]|uniref:Putative acetyltransferase n=1 Tax=Dehalogenimonas alkenigignens TaxID=1217799 RepID=A0A0W0GIB0_9CHLR|nr:putative acetyltransferase [Dehalogenimonas alkenigignens]
MPVAVNQPRPRVKARRRRKNNGESPRKTITMTSSAGGLVIRKERKKDFRAVENLVREAFWNRYIPGCSEHLVLHNLRKHADFIPELDLVAEMDGKMAGQIAFSRGAIRDDRGEEKKVISFGPVSVLPEFQTQGVGSALIRHALSLARDMGHTAACIYGDPRYYSRFGFRCAEKYDIRTSDGKFAAALLALELRPGALRGAPGRFIESGAFAIDEAELMKFDARFPPKDKAETESQREFMTLVSLRY